MNSIQRKLALALALGVILLGSIGGAALYWAGHAGLVAHFDHALQINAQALATCVEYKKNGFKFDFAREFMPPFERTNSPNYYQFWLPDGTTTLRSTCLGDLDLPRGEGSLARPQFWNLTLPKGLSGRAIGVRFLAKETNKQLARRAGGAPSPEEVALVIAWPRDELDQELRFFASILLLVGAATGLATALLVPLVVRHGLRPLSTLAERAATIDATSLQLRFPTDRMPSELLPIGNRLNDLLGRLEASFTRERRFSADVAHELRTPIAELRALSEVAMMWPLDVTAVRDSLQEALAIALQMESVVTTLLALARCEGGMLRVRPERIPLATFIRELYQPMATQAGSKHLSVTLDVPENVCWFTDPGALRTILVNLLSNAVSHSPVDGSVRLSVECAGGRGCLLIANTNHDLSPADLAHLFGRFWRKDPARSPTLHCGLGLALSKACAENLGLELSAALNDHQEITFTLSGAQNVEAQGS